MVKMNDTSNLLRQFEVFCNRARLMLAYFLLKQPLSKMESQQAVDRWLWLTGLYLLQKYKRSFDQYRYSLLLGYSCQRSLLGTRCG